MKKEWLIAHRGAQCDGRENTLKTFRATKKYPLGWVELDVHKTCDDKVVVHHSPRVSGIKIKTHTYTELKSRDSDLLTFDEVMQVFPKSIPLIIDIRAFDVVSLIYESLHTNTTWRVVSFKRKELQNLAKLGISKNRLILHQKSPFRHIKHVLKDGFVGVGKNITMATPLFLWRAHKNDLYVFVFTVNSLRYARFLRRFFPYVGICTNRPDLLQKLK